MAGHTILLNVLGGVALLLWGTRMVQAAILAAFGAELRAGIGRAAAGPVRAAATGALAATALQSATATAVLVTGFATRGLVGLPAALALMLGADLGTSLAVQALSLDLRALVPILLIAGVALGRATARPRVEQVGRLLVGLGLILLSLGLLVTASAPLRESETVTLVLAHLAHDPLLAVVLGAALTWAMHSSVGFILFVVSITATGVVGLPLALALVLGANVGGGLVALGLAAGAPVAGRRVVVGNLGFRLVGAAAALLALAPLATLAESTGLAPGRLVAHGHTLFNLALAVAFLPLTGTAATLLERLLPETDVAQPALDLLDPDLLDRPPLALNAATRALLRLADKVELMLREAILTFDETDARRIRAVEALEREVDAEQEAIKLYLARLMPHGLGRAESAQVLEIVTFTTNLEHIGDIIDRGLLKLAARKQKHGLRFSEAGWADIRGFHAEIAEQMRRALAVYVSRDAAVARELVAAKDRLRAEEARASERHFARLRDGLPETIETSALHLDVLRDLKRINAHLTTVAYPILEQTGEISGSRLRAPVPIPVRATG